MIKKFLSHWHYRKNLFVHALAYRGSKKVDDWHLWMWYRLGMYKSVVDAPIKCRSCHGLFAQAVSLAACGKNDEIDAVLEDLMSQKKCEELLVSLADALAPYNPKKALDLLKNQYIPTPLHVALLLRIDDVDQAAKILKRAFLDFEMKKHPELYLFRANADKDATPQEKLEYLNAFLNFFHISPVVLKDPKKHPSTLNVYAPFQKSNQNGPLVTVIMTTFETGHRADSAIESVLQQTYQNIELIIVDDGSSDETPQIIQSWVKKDKRVKFIRLNFNAGTYIAKNLGLQYANGEFVTCHDSDDWSHPLKIEKQVKPLVENSGLMATVSSWVRVDDDGSYYARPVHPLMRINPSSPLFRRKEVMQHAGIWECVRTGADSEFLARLRLVFGKKAIKRINEPLALGAHRTNSLMTSNATGYAESSVSHQRLMYWEQWSKKHIEKLRHGKKPHYGLRQGFSFEPLTMKSQEIAINFDEAAKLLEQNHNVKI